MRKHFLLYFLVFLSLFLSACDTSSYKHPTVKIDTPFGAIMVELYPEQAPASAGAFLNNIDSGAYKNSNFYRVLKIEDQPSSAEKTRLIQGGINFSDPAFMKRQPGVPLETTQRTGLLHENGTISLARSTAESSATEFFICIGKSPAFDFGGSANADGQGYAAFGRVVKGMEVVKKIHQQPSDESSFNPRIPIRNITLITKP